MFWAVPLRVMKALGVRRPGGQLLRWFGLTKTERS